MAESHIALAHLITQATSWHMPFYSVWRRPVKGVFFRSNTFCRSHKNLRKTRAPQCGIPHAAEYNVFRRSYENKSPTCLIPVYPYPTDRPTAMLILASFYRRRQISLRCRMTRKCKPCKKHALIRDLLYSHSF